MWKAYQKERSGKITQGQGLQMLSLWKRGKRKMIEIFHNSMFWWMFGVAFLLTVAVVSFTVILTFVILTLTIHDR